MGFTNSLRQQTFWLNDWFRGRLVSGNLNDIKDLMTNKDELQVRQRQNKLLGQLLNHATGSCPFYEKTPLDISQFPTIDKNIIRQNFEQFISKAYPKDKLLPVVTSGSTGTPFKVFHNKEKKIRNTADTIYFAGLAGYNIGDRLMYMKIWAKEKMSSSTHYWLQNMVPVDVIHLNDEQISHIIEQMEASNQVHGILGYVSALELVCKYLEKSGKTKVDAKVNSIITMSESLNDYVKETLERFFGRIVCARYSNLENGIIAQQLPESNGRFLVNTASYFVEIFKIGSDEPAGYGETGRIVVTDLFNYAMPMIRYDTGDLGSVSLDKNGYLYFDNIEGRKLDTLFDTKGNIVSSYIMYKNMWKYTEIQQYQLVQKDTKKYLFKINHDGTFNREQELINEFKSYLGSDANFRIEYVEEIPLLSSGKRRKLINEMVIK